MNKIRSELALVFGPEPSISDVTNENQQSRLIAGLAWYGNYGGVENDMSRTAKQHEWISDWAIANGYAAGSFSVPREGITTISALARLAAVGFPLTEKNLSHLHNAIGRYAVQPEPEAAPAAKTVGSKSNCDTAGDAKLMPFLTLFDNTIDEVVAGATKWKLEGLGPLSGVHGKEIKAQYKNGLRELKLLLTGKDAELNEAYAISRATARRLLKLYGEILTMIDAAINFKKATRKPRKKKMRLASDVTKNLKYAASNPEFGLVSIDPVKMIGANVVYTFDATKRFLKQYTGTPLIDLKGQTLKSCTVLQKKLRKPSEQLTVFLSGTKNQCAKEFDLIRAVAQEPAPRMNAETIILRAL